MINKKMFALGNTRSVIRDLFEYGKTLKQQIGEDKVFDFTLGNPSVPCPIEVNQTAANLILNDSKIHEYTSANGDILARKSISEYNYKKYGFKLDANLIYLTCGAAAALRIALSSIISYDDDEILAIAPFFPEYKVFTQSAGGVFKYVVCDEVNFNVNLQELENSITAKTRAIIVNSPNNPSGTVYDEETIKAISKILEKKEKEYGEAIYLITDEPYREILFDGAVCPFIPAYYKNTIICYSYSKALSIPGERIGYVAVSPNCENAQTLYTAIMGAGRALGYVCAPSLFQKILIEHADKVSDIQPYKDNRDILIKMLQELNFTCVNPKGAFYLFIKSPIPDANEFSNHAKKYGLLLVPSDSFGVKGYLRLATCVSTKTAIDSKDAFTLLSKEFNLI